MNYAVIKKNDIANGPGVRVSLFVSGCRHHCRNCFNREAWDFSYGQPFTRDTIDEILNALAPSYVAGLSFLGGEPLEPENQGSLLELARLFKERFPENWENYTVINQVPQMRNGQLAIIIDCGYGDFFFDVNTRFHEALQKQGVDHDFIVRPGEHNHRYWHNSIDYQILFFQKHFREQGL